MNARCIVDTNFLKTELTDFRIYVRLTTNTTKIKIDFFTRLCRKPPTPVGG